MSEQNGGGGCPGAAALTVGFLAAFYLPGAAVWIFDLEQDRGHARK